MTLTDVLTAVKRADIRLEAEGDRLVVDAPVGALTPELRAELTAHKPALLALLAPVTKFVSLPGGLVLPLPAFLLALDLERRGFKLSLDEHQQFQIEPAVALTAADFAAIRQWRFHLGAILWYATRGTRPA